VRFPQSLQDTSTPLDTGNRSVFSVTPRQKPVAVQMRETRARRSGRHLPTTCPETPETSQSPVHRGVNPDLGHSLHEYVSFMSQSPVHRGVDPDKFLLNPDGGTG